MMVEMLIDLATKDLMRPATAAEVDAAKASPNGAIRSEDRNCEVVDVHLAPARFRALRVEAEKARDVDLVQACDDALQGNASAISACAVICFKGPWKYNLEG